MLFHVLLRHQPRAHAVDLVRCARGVDVGYKEDSTSTTSTSTCIHRYPTFLPFGSSRSDGNRWMLKVYFLPSVEPSTSALEVRLRAIHKEQTASRRSQPSSRIASKGELSFPWNLLRKWFTLVLHLYRSLVPRFLFLSPPTNLFLKRGR